MGAIRIRLGYPDDLPDPVLSSDRRAIADDILTKLDMIDSQLDAALPDSLAEELGDIKLNYPAHIGLLMSSGTRLLNQLARIANLALQYDPYTGRLTGTSPFYVVNYW